MKKLNAQNNSAGTAVMGVAGRYALSAWKIGRFNNATNTFTDDTTAFKAGTSLPLPTTVNHGFILLVPDIVNLVDIGMVGATSGGVYEVSYSNTAGGWTTVPQFLTTHDLNAVGEQLIWFHAPLDFGRTTAALVNGIPVGYYALRVRATTLPTPAASIASLVPARSIWNVSAVPVNGVLKNDDGEEWILPGSCDAIQPVTDTANPNNWVTVSFRRI